MYVLVSPVTGIISQSIDSQEVQLGPDLVPWRAMRILLHWEQDQDLRLVYVGMGKSTNIFWSFGVNQALHLWIPIDFSESSVAGFTGLDP